MKDLLVFVWPQEFPWGKFAKLPSVASHFVSVKGAAARNVTAALTDFLITSDCYPLRGDFGLRHGVWRGAHLLGLGLPASLTPWLVCRFAFISLPHWPIIKPQNQRQKQTRKRLQLCWPWTRGTPSLPFDDDQERWRTAGLRSAGGQHLLTDQLVEKEQQQCFVPQCLHSEDVAVDSVSEKPGEVDGCRNFFCWWSTSSNWFAGWWSFLEFANYQVGNGQPCSWSRGISEHLYSQRWKQLRFAVMDWSLSTAGGELAAESERRTAASFVACVQAKWQQPMSSLRGQRLHQHTSLCLWVVQK